MGAVESTGGWRLASWAVGGSFAGWTARAYFAPTWACVINMALGRAVTGWNSEDRFVAELQTLRRMIGRLDLVKGMTLAAAMTPASVASSVVEGGTAAG